MGKFCSNCGKKIEKNDSFCQYCGNKVVEEVTVEKVENTEVTPRNGMALAGFILSFFVSVLGLIFSIIGLVKSKNLNGDRRGLVIAGIIISAISIVFSIFFYIIYFAAIIGSASYYY